MRIKKERLHNNNDFSHQKCTYFAKKTLFESDKITKPWKKKENQVDYNYSRWKTIIIRN